MIDAHGIEKMGEKESNSISCGSSDLVSFNQYITIGFFYLKILSKYEFDGNMRYFKAMMQMSYFKRDEFMDGCSQNRTAILSHPLSMNKNTRLLDEKK